jgi:uncharacterized protein
MEELVRRDVPTLSRRSALGLLGGTAVGLSVGAAGVASAASAGSARITAVLQRQRVVVIGGGIAGVAAAWLLDGVHDVVLLEAAPTLGGHIRTVDVTVGGKQIFVDAGAQNIGPKAYPIYWKMLTQVLNLPTMPAVLNVTVSKQGADRPVMLTPDNDRIWPLFDPTNWGALLTLAIFSEHGKALLDHGDRTTTAEAFINSLPVVPAHREEILFPLVGAMFGFTIAQVKAMSAWVVLTFIVRGRGEGLLTPYDYHYVKGGLRSVVGALQSGLSTVTTHVSSAVTRLSRGDGVYHVQDQAGRVHLADHVVFALPPYAAGPLVGQLSGAASIASVYGRFAYIPGRVAIHTDPIYMPGDRKYWSGFTATHHGESSEASIWLGRSMGVDVFKSWVTHCAEQPKETIAAFDFLHAHETPEFAAAYRALAPFQGEQGLWFAGGHMHDPVSQESALMSAIAVAQRLAPTSPNLARLSPPAIP